MKKVVALFATAARYSSFEIYRAHIKRIETFVYSGVAGSPRFSKSFIAYAAYEYDNEAV